ncbi:MAG: hypothetical protein EHM34_06925 [Nitrosopumilales archaeon]|nr:MAG: hypothetical protein EHM34_06925 [Nitrosopumilales archaeon]
MELFLVYYEEQEHMYEVFLGIFSSRQKAEKIMQAEIDGGNEDARDFGHILPFQLDELRPKI